MKHIGSDTVMVIILIICFIGLIYSFFAGLWGFNPTTIEWFNFKLFASSFVVVVLLNIFWDIFE